MQKNIIEQLKKKLEKEKEEIEKNLKTFAEKDKNLEDNWDARFPKWNGGGSSSDMETEADEVEEYSTLLPLEYALEIRLRNVNLALKKIKKGKYGVCERCGKEIAIKRLKIYPEARYCEKCKK